MDSITIGWNKHSSDEVQCLPNEQDLIEKINNQETKFNKKKVHFNCDTPIIKHRTFENSEQNYLEINRTEKFIFEDHDYITSLSKNSFISRLAEIDDEPIFSVRATIITFIGVILIIIAAALAFGILFGILKTSRNATENANQSSFSTVSTTVITSRVSIGSQNGAPCSSYTTINDPLRNIAQIGSSGSCDNKPLFNASGEGAWIRFVGSGGTIIALSSPGVNHCGGYSTGWFNGTLPTTLGTMVNGSVCFSSDIFKCFVSYQSSVIYCTGSFYIYFLRPPSFCNARYCTT